MNTFNRSPAQARLLALVAAALFTHAADSRGVAGPAGSAMAPLATGTVAVLSRVALPETAPAARHCDAVDAFGNPIRPCRSR